MNKIEYHQSSFPLFFSFSKDVKILHGRTGSLVRDVDVWTTALEFSVSVPIKRYPSTWENPSRASNKRRKQLLSSYEFKFAIIIDSIADDGDGLLLQTGL